MLALLAAWRAGAGAAGGAASAPAEARNTTRQAAGAAGAPFFGSVWAWELLQQADTYSLWPGRPDDASLIDAIVAHNAPGGALGAL